MVTKAPAGPVELHPHTPEWAALAEREIRSSVFHPPTAVRKRGPA